MAKRAEKTRNGNTLSESEYFSKIRSGLRNTFRYWKPAMECLNKSKRKYVGDNKRQKFEYKCNCCGEYFKRDDVNIDHIIPAGSLRTYDDIVPFLKRLTAEDPKNYQVLCRECHKVKTSVERVGRKKNG